MLSMYVSKPPLLQLLVLQALWEAGSDVPHKDIQIWKQSFRLLLSTLCYTAKSSFVCPFSNVSTDTRGKHPADAVTSCFMIGSSSL